jgi:hypothetical protein
VDLQPRRRLDDVVDRLYSWMIGSLTPSESIRVRMVSIACSRVLCSRSLTAWAFIVSVHEVPLVDEMSYCEP